MAEDTRSGRRVAVKVLTRQLPKEGSRREALIRDTRVAAALYHPFLVPIFEITAIDDTLLMVMEAIDGKPIRRYLDGKPRGKDEFFRIASQLAATLKYLHTKSILHGNVNGDSVLVTADGQARLAGLNLQNLLRRERTSVSYQQRANDPQSVAYMAPEQIGGQIDERTDVFSLGVLLYQVSTGRLPFSGESAADLAKAIVEAQPASPRSSNPDIEPAVMSLLGTCLFKDPAKRAKDMKALLDLIEKVDPAAVAALAQAEKKSSMTQAAVPRRRSILFVADVAGYDELAAANPEAATRAAARMQQILGESVYLFDGKVIDPFGTRMIAELPSVENALEAGRKGEFDFAPAQQGSDPLHVRMMLHAGEVEMRDGTPAGPAVEHALETLAYLPADTLFISEEFVKLGRGNVRLRDAGARNGVKLFNIAPAGQADAGSVDDSSAELMESADEVPAQPVSAGGASDVRAAAPVTPRKRSAVPLVAIAAAVVLLVAAAAAFLWMRRGKEEVKAAPVAAVKTPSRPTAENPRYVYLAPFVVEGKDPLLTERATAVQLAVVELLGSVPEVRVVNAPSREALTSSATLRNGASGPEIVPVINEKERQALPLVDSASGIRAIVAAVLAEAGIPARNYAVADALNSFAAAVVARSKNDAAATASSLRSALAADPTLLPAQLVAMNFFTANGSEADAVEAARRVIELDPTNVDAARRVARASLASGSLEQAFGAFNLILKRDPKDAEVLNLVARYATAVNDAPRFNAAYSRLKGLPPSQVSVHEPDLLAAAGRLGVATDRYLDLSLNVPGSPALSLKIGRLSVLRHSIPLAQDELAKLFRSDPLYGYHMLKAYIAAENRNRAEAEKELALAQAVALPGDETWTATAEVYAILADTNGVLAALGKAAERKEPSAAYILANPLFRYLETDPKFTALKGRLVAQQDEIRIALARVPL